MLFIRIRVIIEKNYLFAEAADLVTKKLLTADDDSVEPVNLFVFLFLTVNALVYTPCLTLKTCFFCRQQACYHKQTQEPDQSFLYRLPR